ncbi:MAG: SOS response-associated peptidase [Pseudomonadota bacterium]
MCNEYRSRIDVDSIREEFSHLKIRIEFPEATPNLEPRDSIRITDAAPIVKAGGEGVAHLVQRRWSWPAPNKKPVFNFRSDGREFTNGRCLIVSDGFYEFTANSTGKQKAKWLFTLRDAPWFCIAGLWRNVDGVGEAFTMLTTAPGPDIAPYHDRQVVVLKSQDWAAWLDPATSAKRLLKPLPEGSLNVERVA